MKKNITTLVYMSSFLLLLFFVYRENKITKQLNYQVLQYRKEIDIQKNNCNNLTDYLYKKDHLQRQSNGAKLSMETKITALASGKVIYFKELLKNKTHITVLKISDTYCASCYDTFFNSLQQLNKKNIIILSQYKTQRNLTVFLKKANIDLPVFNMAKSLPLPIEELNTPYIFTLTQTGICNNVFALDKSNLSLTIL